MEQTHTKPSFKSKLQTLKDKFFKFYYSDPAKEIKIIVVTGSCGTDVVANYLQNILTEAGKKSQLAPSNPNKPFSFSKVQKTLTHALQNKSEYIIFNAPANSLGAFSDLPIYMAILTDAIPNQPGYDSNEDYLAKLALIFQQNPIYSILNHDDQYYDYFANLDTETAVISYGRDRNASVRINRSKVYKQGSEANLDIGPKSFDVATFVTSEESIYYMAAATTASSAIGIEPDHIVEGIASYETEQ